MQHRNDRRTVALLAGAGALALAAGVLRAEPMQTFGGELAIADGASGLNIDVNADGIFDVNFAYFGVTVNSIFGWDGIVRAAPGNATTRVAGRLDDNERLILDRFAPGAPIGPAIDSGFSLGAAAYESFFDGLFGGPWLDSEPGFMGFSFEDEGGERHYAWAEIEIDNENSYKEGFLILTRIAYETEAGVPIAAGDTGPSGCNAADLAEPFGLLDLADITAFVSAFLAQEPPADLADPVGLFDLADITAFVSAFGAGCP